MTELDLNDFTDDEKSQVYDLINSIKKNKESNEKWWIMPLYDVFGEDVERFGQVYKVEKQEKGYFRNRPPLKSDFNSKEEAEKWLSNYLEKDKLFQSAIMQIDNLGSNLSMIKDRLEQHIMISEDDWYKCFELFNESRLNGEIKRVTK